jgi:hypothetical protein
MRTVADAKPVSIEYQPRLVAFVDVLGFADLVLKSDGDNEARQAIGRLVATNNLFDAFFTKLMRSAKAGFFSDSFVVSMGPDEIIYLVREIGYLARYLLLLGLPCRGGISLGPLHHEGKVIVGPALIHAYKLERDRAQFPRIVLDDSALQCWHEEFAGEPAHMDCIELVKIDTDNLPYLDLFDPAWSANFLPWTEFIPSADAVPAAHADFLRDARQQIDRGLAAAKDSKVRAKFDWLSSKCPAA